MAIVTLSVASTSALAALELYSGGYTAAEDTNGFKFLNDGKTRFGIGCALCLPPNYLRKLNWTFPEKRMDNPSQKEI